MFTRCAVVMCVACAVMCAQPVSAAPVSPEQSQSVQTYCGSDPGHFDKKYSAWFTPATKLMARKPIGLAVAWGFTATVIVQSVVDTSKMFTLTVWMPEIRDDEVHEVVDVFVAAQKVYGPIWGKFNVWFTSNRCDPMSVTRELWRYILVFIVKDSGDTTVLAQ